MEQFKIRMRDPMRNEFYFDLVDGERVFEQAGYSFFITETWDGWKVSDVLCGQTIAHGIEYHETIEIAKDRVTRNFESYLNQAKVRKRSNWKRKYAR